MMANVPSSASQKRSEREPLTCAAIPRQRNAQQSRRYLHRRRSNAIFSKQGLELENDSVDARMDEWLISEVIETKAPNAQEHDDCQQEASEATAQ